MGTKKSLYRNLLILSLVLFMGIISCNGNNSSNDNLQEDFDLLTSECLSQDIINLPIFFPTFGWSCMTIEGSNEFFAPTLSDLSNILGCFVTISKSDSFCNIEAIERDMFMATYIEFDLTQPLPSPLVEGCNLETAILVEEVVCSVVKVNN